MRVIVTTTGAVVPGVNAGITVFEFTFVVATIDASPLPVSCAVIVHFRPPTIVFSTHTGGLSSGAAATTVKHSLVLFVCEAAAYVASPEYSARQQYVPAVLVAVVAADVAAPPASATAAPTCVPPAEHVPPFAVTCAGAHRKNATLPVGVPAVPLTVAVSLALVPGATPPPVGDEVVAIVAGSNARGTTVKHSLALFVCDRGLYAASPEYSARQQYVPAAVGATAAEVALPLASATAPPTAAPPDAQSPPFVVTVAGSQRKNATVPPGAGPAPLTVAVSVTLDPAATPAPVGAEVVATVAVSFGVHSFVAVVVVGPSMSANAVIVSDPAFVPVYVNSQRPWLVAPVVHDPLVRFAPVTVMLTVTPSSSTPPETYATVTVCGVPTVFVALAGVTDSPSTSACAHPVARTSSSATVSTATTSSTGTVTRRIATSSQSRARRRSATRAGLRREGRTEQRTRYVGVPPIFGPPPTCTRLGTRYAAEPPPRPAPRGEGAGG
jgi:hypothetical protein